MNRQHKGSFSVLPAVCLVLTMAVSSATEANPPELTFWASLPEPSRGTCSVEFSDAPHGQRSYFGKHLQGVDWQKEELAMADFRNAVLKDVRFDGADLSGAAFDGARLCNVTFEGANLQDARFVAARIEHSNFRHVDGRGANFRNATVLSSRLGRANFSHARFANEQ